MKLIEKTKKILEYVQSLFDKEIFLVGGAVRDFVIKNDIKDYDFCSEMSTDEVKEQIKGKHRAYCIGEKFGTIGFYFELDGENIEVEITQFREEEYATGSRKPKCTFGTDLMKDLSRRDFTINSMAISCKTFKLIDPYNGQEDIENKIIKSVGIAKHRFREDPLRILRGIRFAARYSFSFEEITRKRLKDLTYSLLRISKERWVMEMDKILLDKSVYYALGLLWKYDVFKFILPELHLQWGYDQNSRYHNLELWDHTANVVRSAQEAGEPIEMLWSALLHDVAKPNTRTDKIIQVDTDKNNKDYQGTYIKSNYVFHELVGAEMAYKICTYLKFSKDRTTYIVDMIRTHLEKDCLLKKYDDEHKSEYARGLDK